MAHSSIGLPPDVLGGNLLHTHSHFIENETVHNQIFTLGDGGIADNLQRVDEYGAATVKFASGGFEFDSFGKAKVSQETVLSNFIPEYDDLSATHSIETSGTVLDTYIPLEKSIRVGVDTAVGDRYCRTSHKYHKYTAGITNTLMMTVNPGLPKENVVKRFGYFDDNNGLFFSHNGLEVGVNIRSNVTGTPVDSFINKSDFNGDPMDGSGISGVIANPEKSNIYFIDFQWLGVGAVRFGIVNPNGTKILLHTIENANSNDTVYMGSANLPVRHEIFNSGATGSATEMKIHNSTVIQHTATPDFTGRRFSTANANSTATVANEWTAAIVLKQRDVFKGKANHSAAMPVTLSAHADSTVAYAVMKDCTFTGTPTYTEIDAESTVLMSVDAVLDQPGSIMACGFFDAGSGKFSLSSSFNYLHEYLHRNTEEEEPYTLVFKNLKSGETGNVISGLCWEEIRMA